MRNEQINLGGKNAMNLITPVSLKPDNGTLLFQCPPEQTDIQVKTYHYETAERDYIFLDGAYYISFGNEQ